MEYYLLNDSDNIGKYPQARLKKGYDLYSDISYENVHRGILSDFIPNLEIEIQSKAKPTNYIGAVGPSFGFFCDKKLKLILEKHNLPEHKFYPIKVYHKKELLDYYWFHYISDIWNYINLEASTAQIFKKFEFTVEEIIPLPELNTIIKYRRSLPRQKQLKVNELILKENILYDIFNITKIEYIGNIISKKLLNNLINEGITGFEAIPYDKIVSD